MRFLLAIVASFVPALGYPDYAPKTLYQLLTSSEFVVVGNVQAVHEATYSLAISQVILGPVEEEILLVTRIDSLPLGVRALPYAREQELVLFARTTASKIGQPLGTAGEGEMIVTEDSIYVPALSGSTGRFTRGTEPGTQMFAYIFSRDTFIVTVSGFFECFVATGDGGLRQTCTNPDLLTYRNSSELAAHLAGIAGRVTKKGDLR